MESVASPAHWIGFNAFVLFMLSLDLFVFHKEAHAVRVKEALGWTTFWVLLALGFGGLIHYWFGAEKSLEYLTGYVIEEALSVDNLFVFLVVFGYFKVPKELQHRVLFWGILGALLLRVTFIVSGAALVQRFAWIMYLFGAFLVFTGAKLLFHDDEAMDPEQNLMLRLLRKWVPSVSTYRGSAFVVMEGGKRYATPLLFVLLVIEATDIVFAVDSIPAIFAVTQDPFIIYSSNIFAILGLRALFFALAAVMDKFHYLKVGLCFVLVFVGGKMLIVDFYHVPIGISLSVILGILGASVLASLLAPKSQAELKADAQSDSESDSE